LVCKAKCEYFTVYLKWNITINSFQLPAPRILRNTSDSNQNQTAHSRKFLFAIFVQNFSR
jgi:hypothetical protein